MESARKAKMPQGIHIKRAMNGGYIVRHEYDNSMAGPSYAPPTEHAFADHKTMMAHVQKHTAGKSEKEPDPGDVAKEEVNETGAGVGKKITKKAPGPKTRGAGVD